MNIAYAHNTGQDSNAGVQRDFVELEAPPRGILQAIEGTSALWQRTIDGDHAGEATFFSH